MVGSRDSGIKGMVEVLGGSGLGMLGSRGGGTLGVVGVKG